MNGGLFTASAMSTFRQLGSLLIGVCVMFTAYGLPEGGAIFGAGGSRLFRRLDHGL